MFQEGLVLEAKKLHPNKYLNALQTVGYKEIFDYFEGKTTLDFAIEEIKKNTRRFAKRQITWFKKTPNVAWFDFRTNPELIIEHINNTVVNIKWELLDCCWHYLFSFHTQVQFLDLDLLADKRLFRLSLLFLVFIWL
jgi:hypothetical protein